GEVLHGGLVPVVGGERRGRRDRGVERVVDGLGVLHEHERVVHVRGGEVGQPVGRERALRVVPEVTAQTCVGEERLQELHQGQRLGHHCSPVFGGSDGTVGPGRPAV